jgi:hypothetical protein
VKKAIVMVVLGIGGLAAAIALTVGALALAGDEVGNVVQPTIVPSESRSLAPSPSEVGDDPSSTPSPSADDHGGDAGPDDNSGPGSDNSGPGSDISGPDSDNSGPGSDDPLDDD